MADERNVAHDKKVAAAKAKAAHVEVGADAAGNVDGDGRYTTEQPKKPRPQPGKKSSKADDDTAKKA